MAQFAKLFQKFAFGKLGKAELEGNIILMFFRLYFQRMKSLIDLKDIQFLKISRYFTSICLHVYLRSQGKLRLYNPQQTDENPSIFSNEKKSYF